MKGTRTHITNSGDGETIIPMTETSKRAREERGFQLIFFHSCILLRDRIQRADSRIRHIVLTGLFRRLPATRRHFGIDNTNIGMQWIWIQLTDNFYGIGVVATCFVHFVLSSIVSRVFMTRLNRSISPCPALERITCQTEEGNVSFLFTMKMINLAKQKDR